MTTLQKMLQPGAGGRFKQSLRTACALAAGLGVSLAASGQALAQQYTPVTTGAMPASMVEVLDVRMDYRTQNTPRSGFNTSRVVGGALGGLAANGLTKGQGKGQIAATILGTAVGQAVGDAMDEAGHQARIPVVEMTFRRLNDRSGQLFVMMQDANEALLECKPGMQAMLVNMRGTEMVTRCMVSAPHFASSAPVPPSPEQAQALTDRMVTGAPGGRNTIVGPSDFTVAKATRRVSGPSL